MKIISLLVFFILISLKAYALDIDEKLTLRLLNVSNSKRTVLVNRGIEDGLVKGDHAKFYLSTGMIARGVVVKVSPSRSVWSLYRLVTPDDVKTNKVLNLKIATPVKITEDPSKMITVEPLASIGRDIPYVEDNGVNDRRVRTVDARVGIKPGPINDDAELESLKSESETPEPFYSVGSQRSKPWEFYTLGHINNLSTSVKNDTGTTSTSSATGGYDITLGIERYFSTTGSWYEKFSVAGFINSSKSDSVTVDGIYGSNTMFGYGISTKYHFYNHPFDIGRPIGFGSFTFGAGTVTDVTETTSANQDFEGSASFISLGIGVKYYISRFGGYAAFDYYRRSESYTVASGSTTTETTKTMAGPQVVLGFLYRFDI